MIFNVIFFKLLKTQTIKIIFFWNDGLEATDLRALFAVTLCTLLLGLGYL